MAESESMQVLRYYLDLNLTNAIIAAFYGQPGGAYLILGMQGTGKSTYAYYAAKTALIAYHCRNVLRNAYSNDTIMNCVKREFGDICFGKDCEEPDEADKSIRKWVFVGVEDIGRLAEYLKEVVLEKQKPVPVLFIDDIVLKGDWWVSKEHREIIQSFRRINQFRRLAARVVIATAPSNRDVMDFGATFIKVYGKSDWREVRFTRWAVQAIKRWVSTTGEPTVAWQNVIVKRWMDVLPRRKEFGMPLWLEEQINKRKREILRHVLNKLSSKRVDN